MLVRIFVALLGIVCMVAAFIATRIRGGIFSKGPYLPLSRTGRLILFVGGVVIFVTGIRALV